MNLQAIAEQLGGQLIGDGQTEIDQLCAPEAIVPNGLTIIKNADLMAELIDSDIAAIVIPKPEIAHEVNHKKAIIAVDNFNSAFLQLLNLFAPASALKSQIHSTACIEESCQIDEQVEIGPHVVIGQNCQIDAQVKIHANVVIGNQVSIGKNCIIHPNVTIYDNSQIGDNVILHAGTVVGADGFGYQFDGQQHQKRPHLGNVIIGNNVEIGANTTIDRATLGSTIIGDGTKIDNHVQIAHNVKLGSNNILCGFTGVAGSTTTGNNVIMAADVGVSDHVTIGDNVILGARTGIPPKKKLPDSTTWLGNPGRLEKKTVEQLVLIQRLPMLKKQVHTLASRIADIEAKAQEFMA